MDVKQRIRRLFFAVLVPSVLMIPVAFSDKGNSSSQCVPCSSACPPPSDGNIQKLSRPSLPNPEARR